MWFVVSLAVVGSVVLALGAEAAYRQRAARLATRGVQIRYYRHARLQRAMVRSVDYHGVVSINSHGFRGGSVDPVKPSGATRIMVVGASTAFDPCARRDSETWTSRLEYWLEKLVPAETFEVINAAMPGALMLDQIIRLQTELHAFRPDVIIVYAGHGIVNARDARPPLDVSNATPDAAPVAPSWDSWLRTYSRLYERIRPLPEMEDAGGQLSSRQWAFALDNKSADFERDLTSFTLIAQSMGARMVFAEINRMTGNRSPDQFSESERSVWNRSFPTPPEIMHATYERFRGVWMAVAERSGAVFIDAATIGITGPENFCSGDPIHFSSSGSEAMGKRLAEQLVERHVFDRT
jgi:lysophospholipase L1-like esterase